MLLEIGDDCSDGLALSVQVFPLSLEAGKDVEFDWHDMLRSK